MERDAGNRKISEISSNQSTHNNDISGSPKADQGRQVNFGSNAKESIDEGKTDKNEEEEMKF